MPDPTLEQMLDWLSLHGRTRLIGRGARWDCDVMLPSLDLCSDTHPTPVGAVRQVYDAARPVVKAAQDAKFAAYLAAGGSCD